MYPTATRYPGPENASSFRQKPRCVGTGIVPCTSDKLLASLSSRQGLGAAFPGDGVTGEGTTDGTSAGIRRLSGGFIS
jgi:hypothetical protein